MNKFIKSVKGASRSDSREALVKNSITTQLSHSVKEIQLFGMDENLSGDSMDMTEAENSLCTVIEAMFLHGLKDSISLRFRRVLTDVDVKPDPSFWPPLLVISHRQVIDQIQHLSQVNTEIGQCRAWIRLVLNDCLLSSYLTTIRQDSSIMKPYYNTYAYVRDNELLDVAQRLVEGLESFKSFTLPLNSSLLNTWQLPSLLLAGVWAPTLRTAPIAAGVDVAESLQATSSVNSETCSLASALSIGSLNSGIGQIPLSEDEALKIILAKYDDKPSPSPKAETVAVAKPTTSSDVSESDTRSEETEPQQPLPIESSLGNSLNKKSGWSFDESQINTSNESGIVEESATVQSIAESVGSPATDHSFNALIESYNLLGGAYIKTPDIREVWQRYEEDHVPTVNKIDDQQLESETKIEVLTVAHLTRTESISLAAQVGKIAREKGLDAQDFECWGCKRQIGPTVKAKVCGFTGNYFCDDCMSEEAIPIPARIVHNWDFKLYPVSQKAYNYIKEIQDHPTIDFKVLNPYIYGVVEEMANLQILRNQLNFLRAYLYTCQEPVIEQLQKQMWPCEYMYEHIHQYSISDLGQITDGSLAEHLQKVVNFAREHVLDCWLCSQKGFICEVCNKPKPLFPFDVEHVYRCESCSAVYHKKCLNASKPCPKCERRRKREDLPLLGATIE